jgi:hypothetical protein
MAILVFDRKEDVKISVAWFFNSKGTPLVPVPYIFEGIDPSSVFYFKDGTQF